MHCIKIKKHRKHTKLYITGRGGAIIINLLANCTEAHIFLQGSGRLGESGKATVTVWYETDTEKHNKSFSVFVDYGCAL